MDKENNIETQEKLKKKVREELLKYQKTYSFRSTDKDYLFSGQLAQIIEKIRAISKMQESENGNPNNAKNAYVIGVSGERGSGKTSFLETLWNLVTLEPSEICKENKMLETLEIEVLDIIDPGVISNSLSLIEILLSRLYNSINSEKNFKDDKCIEIMKDLKSITKVMAGIKGGQENFYVDVPSLEVLNKIDAKVRFESSISNLIGKYLEIKEKKRLAVLIDDLDLVGQMELSNMLEDIRKYLPSEVLVILAYRESQLLSNVFHDKLIENRVLLDNGEVNKEEIRSQAVRYVEKLIPVDCRIPLLNQRELYCKPLSILLQDCPNTIEYMSIDENDQDKTFETFAGDYIYNQTRIRICPISDKERTRHYLPGNLRGIMQMLSVLALMEPIEDGKEEQAQKIERNLLILKNYFMSRAKDTLDAAHGTIIQGWEDERLERKHFYLYQQVRKKVIALKKEISIIDKLNILFEEDSSLLESYNLSVANVYTALEIYEDVAKDETVYTFAYFMKVLYSILLLQQVLEARAKNNQGEMAAYSQYQALIGGKIVPDSFAYNSRRNPEELYIKVPKEKWEELKGDGQNLINKMIYTEWAKESGLRANRKGEIFYQRYQCRYNCDLKYENCGYHALPLDPFIRVLKEDYLYSNPVYVFYSFFDIDIIVRTNYGRDNFKVVLQTINSLTSNKDKKGSDTNETEYDSRGIKMNEELDKQMCKYIFKEADSSSVSLFTEAEIELVKEILEKYVVSVINTVSIMDKSVVNTRQIASSYINAVIRKIGSLNVGATNIIDELRGIGQRIEQPNHRLAQNERSRINEIMKEYNIVITRTELNAEKRG